MAPTLTSAGDRIALVADPGSFEPWDEDVVADDRLDFVDTIPYVERLKLARAATGSSEAVRTGRATVGGEPVALVASEFGFLGGSVGTATGERVARAFARAQSVRLPLIAITASGGTRMQEGTLALTAMAKLAAAASRFRASGLLYVVYLTHPTTGGVLASWASLGTVTWAEPEALVGFGGPRVVELLTGASIPPGVQSAENLLAHGLIDDVVTPAALRERAGRVLRLATDGAIDWPQPDRAADTAPASAEGVDAWRSLMFARHPDRPSARDLLSECAVDITELRGDRAGTEDRSCLAALARVCGVPAVIVAQDRDRESRSPATMGAAGYRKAARALSIAEELDLPVITIVDTPGAEMSAAAEEAGLSHAIAQVLASMSRVPSPTLSILLGEGGSGGALALLPADVVICAEHASLSPIAPEGGSAILYRDREHAAELAGVQGIASADLFRSGLVDVVVAERPSADREPRAFLARVSGVAGAELQALVARPRAARLEAREQRYRSIGYMREGAVS